MENFDEKMGTLLSTALPIPNTPTAAWARRNHYSHPKEVLVRVIADVF